MVKKRDYEYIADNVSVLYDDMFPLYIVTGEKNLLIDSGAAVFAPQVAARIDKIDTLLLTHSHWDHTGGTFYLQQKYGFDVIASQRTVDLLQKRKVVALIDRMNRGYQELVKSTAGVPFDFPENLLAVKEGDTIRVDSENEITVFETPGHTRCSIAFLLRPGRILFPGDAVGLIDDRGSIRPLFFSNYGQYENSLKKLIGLDAEILAFSHNKFIKGKDRVKAHLTNAIEQARGVKDLMLEFLKKERDTVKIAGAIYEQEFSHTTFIGSRETLMENIEVMVKIVARENKCVLNNECSC